MYLKVPLEVTKRGTHPIGWAPGPPMREMISRTLSSID